MACVEIRLLGRFRVRRDGAWLDERVFGGRLVRRLVRILAVQPGRVVTRDALADALWGARPPGDPSANLAVLVARARRALGRDLVATTDVGYLLRRDPALVVDAAEFPEQVRRAREAWDRGEPEAALAAGEAALALWSGEPLVEDADEGWAAPYRDHLLRAHQEALEVSAAAALRLGRASRALDLASLAVGREPLREAAHLLLTRSLAASGDQAGALAALERLRFTLAEELGLDPSPETRALQQQILHGEVEAAAASAPGTVGRGARSGVTAAREPPLVGRADELAALQALPAGGVALVPGSSGSGKSRLLAELGGRDVRVLHARALPAEREAPWSLLRLLVDQVTRLGLVPDGDLLDAGLVALRAELGEAAPGEPLDPKTRRALALQGVLRLVEAAAPPLVLVDDLQWADSSSLDALALLTQRPGPLRLVLAYRPDEVGDGAAVDGFLSRLRAELRPLEVWPAPLDAAAVRGLVADTSVAEQLAWYTDGTPMAVLEAIRILERRGALRRTGAGWRATGEDLVDLARGAARTGQQNAIWARVLRQPPSQRDLLGLLCLAGRPVPVRVLVAATGRRDSEVWDDVRHLGRADLVRHGDTGVTVAHDLLSDTVRDRLDDTERARLHHRLAQVLRTEGVPADEVARHLARSGDVAAAVASYRHAARHRLERYADQEAATLAEEGLALDPAPADRAALLEIRAQSLARRGQRQQAAEALRESLALSLAPRDRSRLLTRLAELAHGADDLRHAERLGELALAEAGTDPAARARALHTLALVDFNVNRQEQAHARLAEAQEHFAALGDARGVTDVLDARAMAQFLDGDIRGAIDAFDEVATLFRDAGDLLRAVTPRCTRGHALVFAGRPELGLVDIEAALELSRSLGYDEGEAFSVWHLSEALVACGRVAEALPVAESAVVIAARIRHRGWTATSYRALGIAREAAGDLAGAEEAFRRFAEYGDRFPLFSCWAHARLARVLVATGRTDEAAPHVARALATGPRLGRLEAMLADCELAVASGDRDAASRVRAALDAARTSGCRAVATRLEGLRVVGGDPDATTRPRAI